MKISDNLKSSYWFNFLAVCGGIGFVGFLIWGSPYILGMNDGTGDVVLFIFFLYSIFAFICLTISFFIYIAEKIFSFKIKNENFVNNKAITTFQVLGIVFEFIPILLVVYAFISSLF